MKIKLSLMLFLILFIPSIVFANSDYLIASGKTIGVELTTDNVLVVGTYKINNKSNSVIKIGDKITKINNYKVSSAKELQSIINKINSDSVMVSYIRDNTEYNSKINLYKDASGTYKTGLYVRDSIRGVATLTYIDPNGCSNSDNLNNNDCKMTFGSLGHEILEKTTKRKFDAKEGTIFSSIVTGITKSSDGAPGEKNARSNSKDVIGIVKENTTSGVFGIYTSTLPNSKFYKVANNSDIKEGKAKILTVIDGDNVEEFSINILKLNNNSKTKNILFEVSDEKLLNKTGGIIQGMSGSPIIQGDYIIGAVNYVLVDSPEKGYGIFISNMLEEANN